MKEFLQEVFPWADALKGVVYWFFAHAGTFVGWSVEAIGVVINVVVRNRGEESKNQLVECRAQAV